MTALKSIALLPQLAATARNVAEGELVATQGYLDGGRVYRFIRSQDCAFCGRPVDWKRTCFTGLKLPFEPEPVPRALDYTGEGWAPGQWPVRGRTRTVLAPLRKYDAEKRLRVAHVVFVHQCPQYRTWSARIRAGAVA